MYSVPIRLVMTEMMVYMAAEKKTGVTTIKKYCTTKYAKRYGSFSLERIRKMHPGQVWKSTRCGIRREGMNVRQRR